MILRYDLLREYNGGKYPERVEDYLQWFRWIKRRYPDSIPISSRPRGSQIFFNSASIFAMHGGNPYLSTWTGGRVMRNTNLPPMRDAVQIYRQLFRDGLLDPELATQPSSAYFQKLQTKRVATRSPAPGSTDAEIERRLVFRRHEREQPTNRGRVTKLTHPSSCAAPRGATHADLST